MDKYVFFGGMLLGGLIVILIGGLFSSVLRFLFSVAIFYALYKGGRYLWNNFKGSQTSTDNTEDYKPIDITPLQASNYPNKSTIGMDYESKKAADYYRRL